MRTVMLVLLGLTLLGFGVLFARKCCGEQAVSKTAKAFILGWLVVCLYNMYEGVFGAGYSFVEELPFLLVNFMVPASVAVWVLKKYRKTPLSGR